MKKFSSASLLLLTLAACSNAIQSSSGIPTITVVPTRTTISLPTLTLTPVPPVVSFDDVSALSSEGQSDSEWKGIPIMPGVLAGEGDEEGYVFTIKATAQQVQEYYQLELEKRGWQPLTQDDGNSSMTLIYTNNESETLTLSILAKGDQVLVLLVK